jgi:glycerophosphoryl diester phosphodiesterase
VARTHRAGNELHVWTVNTPQAMSRFIDMGVDNIITDRPAVLAQLLQRRQALTDAELLVIKLRNWLR